MLAPDTFEFFARYVLAGYLILASRSRFVAAESPGLPGALAEAVILSFINQAIFLICSPYLSTASDDAHRLLLLELGQAALIGVLSGWLIGLDRIPTGLRRLLFPISRPISDALEQVFAAITEPKFILAAYTDGREVAAYYGNKSFVGTDVQDGGLYVETLYTVSEEGVWNEVAPQRSAGLSLRDIRSIEIFDLEE